MVEPSERDKDKIDQLFRRVDTICYHYKENGEFKVFELPMTEYKSYNELKQLTHKSEFLPLDCPCPFDE